MNTLHEFKVIDFAERLQRKREEKEFKKRYDHIKSKCQIGDVDLFDSLIEEVEVTEDSTRSLSDFINSCHRRSMDPTELFDQAIFLHDEAYHDEMGINWWIAIEEALTYYATLRVYDKFGYKQAITRAVMPD